MASLLDRYAEMQRRPLGTNTALYRNPANEQMGREMRGQQSDFNMARRMLRQEARRGGKTGIAAAGALIGLREEADKRGVELGGIRSAGERMDAVSRFTQGRQQQITDLETKQEVDRGVQTPRLDAGVQTPRLDAAMDPATRGKSFAETDARKKKTLRTQDSFARAESGASRTRNWWDRSPSGM